MTLLEFVVPPVPHYIASGRGVFPVGGKHMSRHRIPVFDLIVVARGCLYIGEEDRRFEVGEGHALILRPNSRHFGTKGCEEETEHFWLHFDAAGPWSVLDEPAAAARPADPSLAKPRNTMAAQPFALRLPQFTRLLQPERMYDLLGRLGQLGERAHLSAVRMAEQALFQDVLRHLSASAFSAGPSPTAACAEKAASYLRQHYREPITARDLAEHINFHPVYIARCMHKEYGCSPTEYLTRIRIEQAKLLLVQSDRPIARIAEEVGFGQAAYFSTCFARLEGISPRKYRQRYSFG